MCEINAALQHSGSFKVRTIDISSSFLVYLEFFS